MVILDDSVFFDRRAPARELHLRVGAVPPGTVICALSPGGAEVAWPTASRHGLVMVVVDLLAPPPVDLRGRGVWLFDDGEAGDAQLAEAARALLDAGATHVDVACPLVSATFRCRSGREGIGRVVALRWREDLPDGAPLYVFPPRGRYRPS